MNIKEHLLVCLNEEASEISQTVDKALRFGLDNRYPDLPGNPTVEEKLIDELNDLLGAVHFLVLSNVLPANWQSGEKILAKVQKLSKYMDYARNRGTLDQKIL